MEYFGRKTEDESTARCGGGDDYGFVDLFCGIGGASQGAVDAGLKVRLAVDSCSKLLQIHQDNHPDVLHACRKLPSLEGVELPSHGKWHLHGSPPCTTLSIMNQHASEAEREWGIMLVRWYLKFAVESNATTWSMEQVPVKEVIDAVRDCMKEHPGKVSYCVKNCHDLGVPQTRKRLFAGTPRLIEKLRRRRVARRAVCDVISNPRGSHTRSESAGKTVTVVRDGQTVRERVRVPDHGMCRPLSSPCVTITAQNGLRWAIPKSDTRPFQMKPRELLPLQTFPSDYKLTGVVTLDTRGIGNAVPPKAMAELLKAVF